MFGLVIGFLFSMLIIGCFGCNSEKRAIKIANKSWNVNHSGFAQVAKEKVPCIEMERKSDTVYKTTTQYDTIPVPQYVTVDCPDNSPGAAPGATIPVTVKANCNCVNLHTYTDRQITTTITIRDTRDSTIQADKIKAQNKTIQKQDKSINIWRVVALIGWAIALGTTLFLIFKPKFL